MINIKKKYFERGDRIINYNPNRELTGKKSRNKTKLIGQKFGILIVIEWIGINNNCDSMWKCKCDCGNYVNVCTSSLKRKPKGKRNGGTKSCGCLPKKSVSTHGKSYSHIYKSWYGMIERCTNENSHSYKDYGGRGIKVCDKWLNSFEEFYKDMGERPKGKTLDRYPDKNGNYELGNCRWATIDEQNFNKRNTIFLTFNNKTLSLKEWSDITKIPRKSIYSRIQRNWSSEKILTTPVKFRTQY